ncbi:hypothetical protein FSP39_018537 [Pinctada imbricata]|uniref:LIM zinc-binding domain-containing protein n=1 Tax=Pinctada imbricata TaxID=66713 RepID=A0AA88XVB0_PINIB|nr:hypothetical protein FSP39_018537 [Pinctada imbricata]
MPSAHKEICAGCQRPIEDRFLLKVMEFSWHEHCVVCSICHAPLSGTCYQRDRKFFCKLDYDKMYRHPCNGCGMHVGSNELVMRAQGFIYHLHCFACVECGQHLKQGDYYALHEGQLFCRLDHEREFMMNLSPKSDDSESYEDCESDGGKHPKRPRTILTTSQRRKFKSAFELNPKPCRKVKKLARRQSQDGNSKNNSGKSKGGDVNKNENCKHETKKEYKDDDDDQDCLKRLGEDESLGSLISESRHHGNVEQISPIPASEYQDSHFGNTMDIGNTVRQTLDDSMTCLDHMFVGEGVPNTASIENNGVVNPIDKLYSMQSSYFSIE